VGLLISIPHWRRAWPLLLLVAATALPMLAFYVVGRFRASFFAALLPFAAFAAVEMARAWRHGTLRRFLVLAAGVLLIGAWTGRPLSDRQVLIRTSDWILPWSVEYESRVYGALDARDPNAAANAYLEFFGRTPTDAQIRASGDPSLPRELAEMRLECAQILRAAGRERESAAQVTAAQHLATLSAR
jgi:hypothetical protein